MFVLMLEVKKNCNGYNLERKQTRITVVNELTNVLLLCDNIFTHFKQTKFNMI